MLNENWISQFRLFVQLQIVFYVNLRYVNKNEKYLAVELGEMTPSPSTIVGVSVSSMAEKAAAKAFVGEIGGGAVAIFCPLMPTWSS